MCALRTHPPAHRHTRLHRAPAVSDSLVRWCAVFDCATHALAPCPSTHKAKTEYPHKTVGIGFIGETGKSMPNSHANLTHCLPLCNNSTHRTASVERKLAPTTTPLPVSGIKKSGSAKASTALHPIGMCTQNEIWTPPKSDDGVPMPWKYKLPPCFKGGCWNRVNRVMPTGELVQRVLPTTAPQTSSPLEPVHIPCIDHRRFT